MRNGVQRRRKPSFNIIIVCRANRNKDFHHICFRAPRQQLHGRHSRGKNRCGAFRVQGIKRPYMISVTLLRGAGVGSLAGT